MPLPSPHRSSQSQVKWRGYLVLRFVIRAGRPWYDVGHPVYTSGTASDTIETLVQSEAATFGATISPQEVAALSLRDGPEARSVTSYRPDRLVFLPVKGRKFNLIGEPDFGPNLDARVEDFVRAIEAVLGLFVPRGESGDGAMMRHDLVGKCRNLRSRLTYKKRWSTERQLREAVCRSLWDVIVRLHMHRKHGKGN